MSEEFAAQLLEQTIEGLRTDRDILKAENESLKEEIEKWRNKWKTYMNMDSLDYMLTKSVCEDQDREMRLMHVSMKRLMDRHPCPNSVEEMNQRTSDKELLDRVEKLLEEPSDD